MGDNGSVDQSLELCLQELQRTHSIEASLARCPERASQLRPLLEIAQATHRHYQSVPAPPGGLVTGRERLLAVAAQGRRASRSTPTGAGRFAVTGGRRKRLTLSLKLGAAVLVVVLDLAAPTMSIARAASDSLPGDSLYPVKLVAEDVRLRLVSAPADQVDLTLGLVEERAEEILGLTSAGRHIPDETLDRLDQHVERAVVRAAWAGDEEIESLLAQIVRRARTQARILEQRRQTAPQQAQDRLVRAHIICRRAAEMAEEGLGDPSSFQWRYRHGEGQSNPTVEPEQGQERRQHRNEERWQDHTGTPASPSRTPKGPRATCTPQATPLEPQVTAALEPTPRRPDRSPTPEATSAPQSTPLGPQVTPALQPTPSGPHATPLDPQATSAPQSTPHGPQATSTPQSRRQGPQATSAPQSTPQGPQATSAPQSTPSGPQATSAPLSAPQKGPQATSAPQTVPQGPQVAPSPQSTPKGPQASSQEPPSTPANAH